jgi:hypothetical protein
MKDTLSLLSFHLRMFPHIDAQTTAIYLCIDNTSAIEALRFNKYNSEPARQAIKTACAFLETGWQISTVWTPSHSDILGNELADKMAKKGAENNGNERSGSFTSKAWLQARVKQQLRMKCKTPMLGFPLHTCDGKIQELSSERFAIAHPTTHKWVTTAIHALVVPTS